MTRLEVVSLTGELLFLVDERVVVLDLCARVEDVLRCQVAVRIPLVCGTYVFSDVEFVSPKDLFGTRE